MEILWLLLLVLVLVNVGIGVTAILFRFLMWVDGMLKNKSIGLQVMTWVVLANILFVGVSYGALEVRKRLDNFVDVSVLMENIHER